MDALNVPARRLHWAVFAAAMMFALIGFGLMLIARNQSMSWSMAWYAAAHGLLPSAVMLILGLFLRQRYLRHRG